MRVRLLCPDRDFDPAAEPPATSDTLVDDLGLRLLFGAMSGGDPYLDDVARRVVLTGTDDPDLIEYRLDILDDCLREPGIIRDLYAIAVDAMERQRSVWGWSTRFADTLVQRSVDILGLLLESLRRVRAIAASGRATVRSDGLRRLFEVLEAELDEPFIVRASEHLRLLRRRDVVIVSASLGDGLRPTGFVLRRRVAPRTWRERLRLPAPGEYRYELAPRDEAGAQLLGDLRKRGLAVAADALAQSSDHVVSFFAQLRAELAFYVGCLNARDALVARGQPTCRPEPLPVARREVRFAGLYDPCLSLASAARAVGNDLAGEDVRLVVVTGANRGGKSTFLRSLGIAQLMMQAGMFVPADSFRAPVRTGVFTHFRREEDASLRSGKLDDELGRLSALVDGVRSGALVLLNESFASTNEREGAEIGQQVITALLDSGVTVGLVTHVFELASVLLARSEPGARFLRAERLADGTRTYRVVDGEPLPTSHGGDLYRRVFEGASATQV